MHCLWFPVRLAIAAPIQITLCAVGCWTGGSFACMLRTNPALLAAAGRICHIALACKQVAVVLMSGAAGSGHGNSWVCDDRPVELLTPLFGALGCLLPLYVLSVCNRILKARHLEACAGQLRHQRQGERKQSSRSSSGSNDSRFRGGESADDDGQDYPKVPFLLGGTRFDPLSSRLHALGLPPFQLLSPGFHLFAVLCILTCSFIIAEGFAVFGKPYVCGEECPRSFSTA